jgi:hypothetical protein
MNNYPTFPKPSGAIWNNPGRIWGLIQKKSGQTIRISGKFEILKPAIFPTQKHTNPEDLWISYPYFRSSVILKTKVAEHLPLAPSRVNVVQDLSGLPRTNPLFVWGRQPEHFLHDPPSFRGCPRTYFASLRENPNPSGTPRGCKALLLRHVCTMMLTTTSTASAEAMAGG